VRGRGIAKAVRLVIGSPEEPQFDDATFRGSYAANRSSASSTATSSASGSLQAIGFVERT
jgi:hypothetical protein